MTLGTPLLGHLVVLFHADESIVPAQGIGSAAGLLFLVYPDFCALLGYHLVLEAREEIVDLVLPYF